jgi:hypothetical protein
MVCTINRPLDDKANVLTIAERDAIPLAQRYKGMVLVVQNTAGIRPQIFWLPSEDLTNAGWEEIEENKSSVVLIPVWVPGVQYAVGQVIVNDEVLYRCNTAHTSPASFDDDEWDVIAGKSKEYKHEQSIASDTWLIQHNLNASSKAITLFAINTEGEQIVGFIDLSMSTNNLLVYKFGEPLAGEAHIKI